MESKSQKVFNLNEEDITGILKNWALGKYRAKGIPKVFVTLNPSSHLEGAGFDKHTVYTIEATVILEE